MSSFTLGVAPPNASSKAVNPFPKNFIGKRDVLPFGRVALCYLGGKRVEKESGKGSGSDFPEDKIVIPVGVTPQNLRNYTLYDMLGFAQEWGASADTEAIKKAYHKAVLMYHPDKAQYKTADGKEDRTVFLKIQEAFNVLSNETKRRAYDSQLPFDESIPTEEKVVKGLAKGNYKFFKMFGPVFKRNARFAVKKPVPDLGDMDTPLDEVYKFYEYWVNFESWRDFTGVDCEHKPDDAGSREEKRWMMKENERIAKKLKKKEMERLIALVTIAEKYDPRVVADKEKRRQAKEADKMSKEQAAKMKAEQEAAAKEWDEKEENEAKLKKGTTKEEREKVKKAQSKARNTLKKLLRSSVPLGHTKGEYGIITDAELEIICASCQMDQLNAMNNAMGGEAASKDAALLKPEGFDEVHKQLNWAMSINDQVVEDEQIAKDAKKVEQTLATSAVKSKKKGGDAVADREWSADDLEGIKTCLIRYPAGTPDRWVKVSSYMNVKHTKDTIITPEESMVISYRVAHGLI